MRTKLLTMLWLIGFFGICFADAKGAAAQVNLQPRYIVLVGPPGAGKGVLAQRLAESEGLPILTTRQVLKNLPEGPATADIKALMQSCTLIPDEMLADVMRSELTKPDYAKGVIFDGFPRTVSQADFFQENQKKIESVIVLHADESTLVQRISGRRVHEQSGRVYHIESKPPQVEGKDDITGEALVQRPDDQESVVRARLQTYSEQTEPVIAWAIFAQGGENPVVSHVVIVDASQSPDAVWQSVCTKLAAEAVQLKGCAESGL